MSLLTSRHPRVRRVRGLLLVWALVITADWSSKLLVRSSALASWHVAPDQRSIGEGALLAACALFLSWSCPRGLLALGTFSGGALANNLGSHLGVPVVEWLPMGWLPGLPASESGTLGDALLMLGLVGLGLAVAGVVTRWWVAVHDPAWCASAHLSGTRRPPAVVSASAGVDAR